MRAQVTAKASTDVFVGQGSIIVTVLSVELTFVIFVSKRFHGEFTFSEIRAWIAASEEITIVFISKVENENFLRNVHFIITLTGFISDGTTLSAPRFHRVTAPFTYRWFAWTQAIFDVTLKDDTVTFGETESFVDGLKCVGIGCEAGENAVVDWATNERK